jgi:hypothetical protein
MYRTPLKYLRGIRDYKADADVRMDDFASVLPVGTDAPEFTLETPDGEEFTLSDHRGEYVVLEFGSYTCPMYREQAEPMARVAERFRDDERVTFVTVYGPEAHPNQGAFRGIGQHESYEDRRTLARRLTEEEDVPMPVLVDRVPRDVTAAYGGAPNMVYVVGPDGDVVYRDRWTDTPDVERFLWRELKTKVTVERE